MSDEWPEILESSTVTGRRPGMSRSAFVSLALSIGLHALALVVLVRMGVLRGWTVLSFQGRGSGADVADASLGGPAMSNALPSSQLPAAASSLARPAIDSSTIEPTIPAVPFSVPAAKSPTRLIDESSAPEPIGVPIGQGQVAPQFAHALPAHLRTLSVAGPVSSGSEVANGVGDVPYLMNHAGSSTTDAKRAGSGPAATQTGTARPSGDDGSGTGGESGGGSGFVPSARNKKPTYPPDAMRRGYQGTVRLAVDVREDGSIDAVSVEQSSGYDMLDDAALEGVRRWHFNWNKSVGAPQPMRIFVPIEFVQHAR